MANDNDKEAPLSRGRGAGGEGGKGKRSEKLPLHAGAEQHQFKYAKQLRREMMEFTHNPDGSIERIKPYLDLK